MIKRLWLTMFLLFCYIGHFLLFQSILTGAKKATNEDNILRVEPHKTREFKLNLEDICDCYETKTCQALLDGRGRIDVRIVTPEIEQRNCSAGMLFCCPFEMLNTTTEASTTTEAATTTEPPTTTTMKATTTTTELTTTTTTLAPTTTTEEPIPFICGNRSVHLDSTDQGLASYGEYPWEAVIFTKDNVYVGGGVLIDIFYVLTAAHKIYNQSVIENLKIRLGEWNYEENSENYAQDYDIVSYIIHPDFNSENLHNDVAILKVNRPVQLNEKTSIICLPMMNDKVYDGEKCWVSGWGKNAYNGDLQAVQKEVDVPVVPSVECQTALRNTKLGQFFNLDSSFICAGGEAEKDACTGDGGSPLVCELSENRWAVIGLVAWGIGCGQPNIPGVYVNVAQFLPWIEEKILQDILE